MDLPAEQLAGVYSAGLDGGTPVSGKAYRDKTGSGAAINWG